MADTIVVRPAIAADAGSISELIHTLLHHRTPVPVGPAPDEFLALSAPRAIEGYIQASNYNYFVAVCQDRLIGVLGIRDNRHLVHLFVAEAYQGRGIARVLWQQAKSAVLAAEAEVELSVRSSIYAIKVYERFGFIACGPRVDDVAVSYVPMRQVIRRGE